MIYDNYGIAPNFDLTAQSDGGMAATLSDYGTSNSVSDTSYSQNTDSILSNSNPDYQFGYTNNTDLVSAFLGTNDYINSSFINMGSADSAFTQLKSSLDGSFINFGQQDDSQAELAKNDDGTMNSLSGAASTIGNSIKGVYNGLSDGGKEFVWKAAAGMLGAMATASTRKAQAKAQTIYSQAQMQNAETNRLNYQLSADEKAKDRANATNTWNGVPKVATPNYAPVGLLNTNISKRMGG